MLSRYDWVQNYSKIISEMRLCSIGGRKPQIRRDLKDNTDLCSIGDYEPPTDNPLESVAYAVFHTLQRLHAVPVPPDPRITAQERNHVIQARFAAGETQTALAIVFGISIQRIHQIVRGKNH